ncbi:MAG: PP2C family protein-serine/threonine phosphatase [Phycisphaerales bacterium]|nr:PP2C family protein-serine/threonine phosphatase [Phycisphaerales bacterium]
MEKREEIAVEGSAELAMRARGVIGRRIALLAFATALASALAIAWLGYRAETAAYRHAVDAKLRAIAPAIATMLPGDWHARVRSGAATSAEYDALVEPLTRYADEAGVFYVYSYIERDGRLLAASTSASARERIDRSWSKLLSEYQQAPAEIRRTLADGATRYASYTDEFGSFRSVFARGEDAGGPYVIGVDVSLDEMRAMARANLLRYAAAGLGVGAVVSLLGMIAGRRISRPIERLRKDIETFADDDFANDDAGVEDLSRLAAEDRSETGALAATFVLMRKQLARHIDRLVEVTAEKERVTSQLSIARDIQKRLLPDKPPVVAGFSIAGWSEAAEQTGGDFYDWVEMPDGKLVVTIADATGHGLGPAMMASLCRAYMRATIEESDRLGEFIARLNKLVVADTQGKNFVTFFIGVLDPSTRRMMVLSAGHGPVLVYRARTKAVEEAETHTLPLGIVEDLDLTPGSLIAFEPGDVMLLISDGFFEWANSDREQFGIPRLRDTFASAAGLRPAEVIDRLRADLAAHVGGTPQPDDMTAMVIRCGP